MSGFPSRCCQVFALPCGSMMELRGQFRKWFARREADPLRTIQLLIPKRLEDLNAELFELLDDKSKTHLQAGGVMWSCKYFDPISGVCGIYDHRPEMCRKFPSNDLDNKNSDGVNILCGCCTSVYCDYHPDCKKEHV